MNQVLVAALLLSEATAFNLPGIVPRARSSMNPLLDLDLSRRTHGTVVIPGSSKLGVTTDAKVCTATDGARGIFFALRSCAGGAKGSCSDTAGGEAHSEGSDDACPGTQQETIEDDSDEISDVDIDAEIEKLVKGIEHGSSRNTWRNEAARRGDMDEMKMVLLLRKQMGEEDFYKVFDPRNPRIGDI